MIVKLFLGDLREAERDAVSEGLRWNLTELCIVMTIFRDEMSNPHHSGRTKGKVVATSGVMLAFMFLSLVVTKCLHWAVEIRGLHNQHLNEMGLDDFEEEHVDQNVGDPVHDENENNIEGHDQNPNGWRNIMNRFSRLVKNACDGNSILSFILLVWDVLFATSCIAHLTANGPSLRLMFAFEYAILAVSACTTIYLHVLHVIDMMHQAEYGRSWNMKSILVLATELWADAFKFMFYLTFFAIIFSCYGMPLNLLRDLYMTFNNLKKRISIFMKYRELTKNMNDRFRDATNEELEECGHICIICRDAMEGSDIVDGSSNKAKVLPCGHVFHFFCLRSWLQQQQSCPTCRQNIPDDARSTPVESPANDIDDGDHEWEEERDETNALDIGRGKDGEEGPRGYLSDVKKRNNNDAVRLDFATPLVYKVTNPDGAKVFSYETMTKNARTILRTIPEKKVVVCTARQRAISVTLPDEMMLRIPDGWICDCDVQMMPSIDLSKFAVASIIETEMKHNNTKHELLSMQDEIRKLKEDVRKRLPMKRQPVQSSIG